MAKIGITGYSEEEIAELPKDRQAKQYLDTDIVKEPIKQEKTSKKK